MAPRSGFLSLGGKSGNYGSAGWASKPSEYEGEGSFWGRSGAEAQEPVQYNDGLLSTDPMEVQPESHDPRFLSTDPTPGFKEDEGSGTGRRGWAWWQKKSNYKSNADLGGWHSSHNPYNPNEEH
jgi:hypothetical protein